MISGLHHFQKRKRGTKTLEPIPGNTKLVRTVDHLAYLSVIVPLMTIPQFITIFAHHNASNLSLITWGTYLVSAVYWTTYGWLHKEAPIWFPNSLMVLVDIGVVTGILLYG